LGFTSLGAFINHPWRWGWVMNFLAMVLPLFMVVGTSLGLILHLRWRWTILALVGQYLAVSLLVLQNLSLGLAGVKLVAGLMAGAVLAASHSTIEDGPSKGSLLPGGIFRVFAALLIFIVVFSIEPQAQEWLPAGESVLLSGLILVFMGLFQLGMTGSPFRTTVGLLTTLSGFEVIYATVVSSVLVAGLLAMITLGLALAGAYLMNVEHLAESE